MKDVVKKEGDPGWGELGDWDGPQPFRKFVSFFFRFKMEVGRATCALALSESRCIIHVYVHIYSFNQN